MNKCFISVFISILQSSAIILYFSRILTLCLPFVGLNYIQIQQQKKKTLSHCRHRRRYRHRHSHSRRMHIQMYARTNRGVCRNIIFVVFHALFLSEKEKKGNDYL